MIVTYMDTNALKSVKSVTWNEQGILITLCIIMQTCQLKAVRDFTTIRSIE